MTAIAFFSLALRGRAGVGAQRPNGMPQAPIPAFPRKGKEQ